jgi:hypothetical protein
MSAEHDQVAQPTAAPPDVGVSFAAWRLEQEEASDEAARVDRDPHGAHPTHERDPCVNDLVPSLAPGLRILEHKGVPEQHLERIPEPREHPLAQPRPHTVIAQVAKLPKAPLEEAADERACSLEGRLPGNPPARIQSLARTPLTAGPRPRAR